MSSKRSCAKCQTEFLLIEQELKFYQEKDLPLPTECPKCRQERRMSQRNERELYGYSCDKCGKDIVVAFSPPEDQEIYCKTCYQQFMQENDCIVGYSEGAKKE